MNNGGIMVATAVVAGSTILRNTIAKKDAVTINTIGRPLIAGFMLGLVLFAVNMISSRVAIALAVLMVTAALLTNGDDVFKAVGRTVK